MARITPIPTTRVSDQLALQRMMNQLQSDQVDVLRIQQQISTGRRILMPSEDAPAALRAVALQRILEQKKQMETNLQTSESYLTNTDTAIASVSDTLNKARDTALHAANSVNTDEEREADAQEIDQAITSLILTGNSQFRDRYLFAGSRTTEIPFEQKGNYIRYNGNETELRSYADTDVLFPTNITGSRLFGAISEPVVGTADFNPILTLDTKLADLNNGDGVSLGSIEISDGTVSSVVDLSTAYTVRDVVDLIEANPPAGRTVEVEVTRTGLNVSLDAAAGGNLRIVEVGGGTTARELGILAETFIGTGPVVGNDLNPRLTLTTPLADALGARAYARVDSPGSHNSLLIEAQARGAAWNGFTVNFVDDPAVTVGNEFVVTAGNTFTVRIDQGVTAASDVMAALNADPTFSANFQATLDTSLDPDNDGTGIVDVAATGTTAQGAGVEFDQASGLQIYNGDQTHVIDISTAVTVEDLLNTLNKSTADVLAQLNADGRTISIRSRLSGADFAIGENGGQTATHLGMRTLITTTRLEDLNYGYGVHADSGDDFIIRRKDGVELRFDVNSAQTIGDVINLINTHADNLDSATRVTAQLAVNGNGIEIIDNGVVGTGELTILKINNSQAAEDLGLVPVGQTSITSGAPSAFASALVPVAGANNDLVFTAAGSGPQRNGVQIIFNPLALGSDSANVTSNAGANTLTIDYDPALTTANTIVTQVDAEGTFDAALDLNEPGNDGTGLIGPPPPVATTAGGTSQTLTGRDTNPQEVDSIFNSLIRLQKAIRANDLVQMSRATEMIEEGVVDVNFARAEIGARSQGLDVIKTSLEEESLNLQDALADEIEVDLAEAISSLVARSATLQASLQMTGQLSRLTLLDFL